MKDIEAFYALAYKYGFIDFETYVQAILDLSVSAVFQEFEERKQPDREYESELLARVG